MLPSFPVKKKKSAFSRLSFQEVTFWKNIPWESYTTWQRLAQAFVETPLCQTQRLPLNFHRVLQCVAVCCSVLQRIAVCCSVLQCVAVCCSVSQCVAGLCHSVLEMCCSALQGAATRFSYTHLPSPTFAYGEGCGKEVIWQRRWLYCSLCQVFFSKTFCQAPPSPHRNGSVISRCRTILDQTRVSSYQ